MKNQLQRVKGMFNHYSHSDSIFLTATMWRLCQADPEWFERLGGFWGDYRGHALLNMKMGILFMLPALVVIQPTLIFAGH